MENNFFLNDDLLWDYNDGLLTADEELQIEAYLLQHPEWQEKLEHIRFEQKALSHLPLEKPRPSFSDRVMAAIASESLEERALVPARKKDWIIYAIAGVFALFILTPVIFMVVAALNAAPQTTALLPVELPATAIDWNLLAGNTVFHYILYLGFVLIGLRFLEKFFQTRFRLRTA